LGELCGLRWSDFSEHNGKVTVHIQRTLNRIPDLEKGTGTIINISAPKTKAANRIIPLNQTVVEFLKKHWMKQTELLGKEYATGDHYVLSRIPNKPVEPKFMQMRFKRFLCESHITDANFHALRHTFATRALEANVDYKTLSVLLGHANVTTTMNLYQHILLDQKIVAMEKILQQF
jgi:integrase